MSINTNPNTYVEPSRKADDTFSRDGDYVEQHPAYAMIGAYRVTGGKVLFGSDFQHQNYITIRIKPGQVRRSLSNDWFGVAAGREYIEVSLSEAQWAGLISRLNVGDGVPCTLGWKEDVGYVPQIPEPPEHTKQFSAEMKKLAEKGDVALKELADVINGMKISEKQRKELLWKIEQASRAIGSSASYIQEQFGEHMESVKERAFTEVYAFTEAHIRRSGLAALGFKPEDVLKIDNDDKTIDAE